MIRFRLGEKSNDDEPGRPSTSRSNQHVEKICAVMLQERERTIKVTAELSARFLVVGV